jgi:hypothetical protein
MATPPPVLFLYTGQPRDDIPKNVTHVVVDSMVEEIGGLSFFRFPVGSSSLEHVKIPATVKSIEHCAFGECRNLDFLDFKEGLSVIGVNAFQNCTSITRLKIPSSVEEIKQAAFVRCEALVSVELQAGLLSIGNSAFSGCSSLKTMRIPQSVNEIGEWAFSGCQSLRSVQLPKGLRVIENCAFSGCASLVHVKVPSSIKKIGNDSFRFCEKLISMEFPHGLEIIGEGAFAGCYALASAFIPSTVEVIGIDAFEYCRNIENLAENDSWRNDSRFLHALIDGLKQRFENLPIHELCYFQAHMTNLIVAEKLQKLIDLNSSNGEKVDKLGMTPFHILALSVKPSIFLFQLLAENCSISTISREDGHGKTSMDYLCLNTSVETTATVQYVIHFTIFRRLRFLRLKRWRVDISNEVDKLSEKEDANTRAEQYHFVKAILAKYERSEALSLLEEAVWKAKIESSEAVLAASINTGIENSSRKKAKINSKPNYCKVQSEIVDEAIALDRQNCRSNCGADIIIVNVLPFVGEITIS